MITSFSVPRLATVIGAFLLAMLTFGVVGSSVNASAWHHHYTPYNCYLVQQVEHQRGVHPDLANKCYNTFQNQHEIAGQIDHYYYSTQWRNNHGYGNYDSNQNNLYWELWNIFNVKYAHAVSYH